MNTTTVDHWHHAQFHMNAPNPGMVKPTLSPNLGDHSAAHATVQSILDAQAKKLGDRAPGLRDIAAQWRRGATDDTVFWGEVIWTLFSCAGDCRASAEALLEEWAVLLGQAGAQIFIPPLPSDWPAGHTDTGTAADQDVPRAIITKLLGSLVIPNRPYPGFLEPELEPWHAYVADSGHCLVVALAEHFDPAKPLKSLTPAPVRAVRRAGWHVRDGFVVTDLSYDPVLGLVTDAEDEEF